MHRLQARACPARPAASPDGENQLADRGDAHGSSGVAARPLRVGEAGGEAATLAAGRTPPRSLQRAVKSLARARAARNSNGSATKRTASPLPNRARLLCRRATGAIAPLRLGRKPHGSDERGGCINGQSARLCRLHRSMPSARAAAAADIQIASISAARPAYIASCWTVCHLGALESRRHGEADEDRIHAGQDPIRDFPTIMRSPT